MSILIYINANPPVRTKPTLNSTEVFKFINKVNTLYPLYPKYPLSADINKHNYYLKLTFAASVLFTINAKEIITRYRFDAAIVGPVRYPSLPLFPGCVYSKNKHKINAVPYDFDTEVQG